MWPRQILRPLTTICTASVESMGNMMFNGGNLSLNTYASTAWPTINAAIFVPFFCPCPLTFATMFWVNGLTVTGNVDVGVYNADGTLIVHSGSTAASGASAIQLVTVTSTTINAGNYYFAMAASSVSGTYYRTLIGQTLRTKLAGLAQQSSALPLPSTATMVTVNQDYVPMVGLSTRSTI